MEPLTISVYKLHFNVTNRVVSDVAFKKIGLLQTAEEIQVTKVYCMRERGGKWSQRER